MISNTTNDSQRSRLNYTIILKRQYVNQLLSLFLPSWLIWLVAYLTFFIPLKNFNNRFMGSVTSLLVLTSLLNSVQKTLPETAYFKNIDCWFLWFIFNSIIMIGSHVIIDNLPDGGKTRNKIGSMIPDEMNQSKMTQMDKNKLNRIVIIVLPIINSIFYLFYFFLHI